MSDARESRFAFDISDAIHSGIRAARAGNLIAARAIFRSLTRNHPDEYEAWWWLAEVTDDLDERCLALSQVLRLQPAHQEAQYRRHHFGCPESPPVSSPPSMTIRSAHKRSDWLIVAAVGFLFLVVVWVLGSSTTQTSPAAEDTHQLSPTAMTILPDVRATVEAATTPFPLPAYVAMGTLVEHDGWYASLMRVDHTRFLDGNLGGIAPEGRFVLTVISVSNSHEMVRTLPQDFFVLIDDQGRSYRIVAGASQAYLSAYGRGIHGDIAAEDPFPARSGMLSIPLIFDVPHDATNLVLTMTRNPVGGWPVPEPVPTSAP